LSYYQQIHKDLDEKVHNEETHLDWLLARKSKHQSILTETIQKCKNRLRALKIEQTKSVATAISVAVVLINLI